jgi:hypothetical protein
VEGLSLEGAFPYGGKMGRRPKMIEKAEEKKRKAEAGLVSDLFPKVTEISISMLYSQAAEEKPLSRNLNFSPGSSAVFKINCLCADCVEGRFDFTKIINEMASARKTASKGVISCEHCSAPECSDVAYSVMIKYAPLK